MKRRSVNQQAAYPGNSSGITMRDISLKAGVSIGTVDRALNGRERISDNTKKRVLQAAKELGYQRNEFARALSIHKKTRIVAVYQTIPAKYTQNFTKGFEVSAERLADFGLEFTSVRTRTLDPQEIIDVLRQVDLHDYDGLLINASGSELNPFINSTIDRGIPVATFNSDLPQSKRLFFCGEDHIAGGRMSGELTAKLLRGTGTIGLFSGLSSSFALQQRISGFKYAIENGYEGIKIVKEIQHGDILEQLQDKAEELLFGGEMPDAVFCNSATGVLPICEAIQKYRLFRRPIVVGYDYDEALKPMFEENICTALIYQYPQKQAYNALQYMFRYLYGNGSIPNPKEAVIMPTVILGSNLEVCG